MYRADTDEFAFTRAASANTAGPVVPGDVNPPLELRRTSIRYAAIVALGAHWLSDQQQRAILGGHSLTEFISILVNRLPKVQNLGDAALVAWAAAQSGGDLDRALTHLRVLDDEARPQYVVEASWVVAALAAARKQSDVEAHLANARQRLLESRHGASPLFPHATGRGLVPYYRSHVACYADQVYPIQALARLHGSGDDEAALRAATAAADRICELQGDGGQWWWHYDARTGQVVEGYPVYTVHQHAMGPMALLDLTEAGGPEYREPIERGLRWIVDPAEFRGQGDTEQIIREADDVTWRKVFRGDPGKAVRAVHGLSTRLVRGMHMPGVDRMYRPDALDRECRPYEFGWLLFAWRNRDTGVDR
jgi:hypothetical protein